MHPFSGEGGYFNYRISNAAKIIEPFLHIGIFLGKIVLVANNQRRNPGNFSLYENPIQKTGPERGCSRGGNTEEEIHISRNNLSRRRPMGSKPFLIKPREDIPSLRYPQNQSLTGMTGIVVEVHPVSWSQRIVIPLNPFQDLTLDTTFQLSLP
jgi:hypothetical protein